MRGSEPETAAMNVDRLRILKERVAEGRYFENWMKRNLLENDRRCLLTVESDSSYEERLQAELQEEARTGEKAGAKEKKAFLRFVNTPDSPEALATIESERLQE